MNILKRIPKSIVFLFWMTILTGVVYPLAITGVAQLAFPGRANGSLIVIGGRVKGSRLLAQEFSGERFFKPRPSAAATPTSARPDPTWRRPTPPWPTRSRGGPRPGERPMGALHLRICATPPLPVSIPISASRRPWTKLIRSLGRAAFPPPRGGRLKTPSRGPPRQRRPSLEYHA